MLLKKMSKDKDINSLNEIYFIGIGGIGMSALARHFNEKGIRVSGYDRFRSELCELLEKEGMDIHYEEDIKMINRNADLIVYTPAIPSDHLELSYYRSHGYDVKKRSQVLGDITKNKFTIAVAGSHGKTTVSSMIAHILNDTGYGCNAFLGGIANNFNSNYHSSGDVIVVEADEYDRSFLTLNPNIAVITSIDTDHLDVYGSYENIKNEFKLFVSQIKKEGVLITQKDIDLETTIHKTVKYTLDDLTNYNISNGIQEFEISQISNCSLNIGGKHNVENMLAAIKVAIELDISISKIRDAVYSFKGIRRRFDKQFENSDLVYIDDYAHHPNEIRALLSSIKDMYGGWPITCIFQPHLYSRTNDLKDEFAKQLSKADKIMLLPIYPAREKPIEGVTSQVILDHITHSQKEICTPEQVLQKVNTVNKGVLLTIGAGSIDQLVDPIRKILEER